MWKEFVNPPPAPNQPATATTMTVGRSLHGSKGHKTRPSARFAFLFLLPWILFFHAVNIAAEDPRILLIEQQAARQPKAALTTLEQTLAEKPEQVQGMGLEYLKGHLLLQLDRQQEALQAFATTMATTPDLEPYSRYRMALEQESLGHPEIAAGLVATLLGSDPPSSMVDPAMRLLSRLIKMGGDCRLLRGLQRSRWDTVPQRRIRLIQATCDARQQEPQKAQQQLLQLLEEKQNDDIALQAAEELEKIFAQQTEPAGQARQVTAKDVRTHLMLGMTHYHHREFEIAIPYLARVMVQLPSTSSISSREAFESRYALARSHFWLGRYPQAAAAFGGLVSSDLTPRRHAQVLYQKARCFELNGDWQQAIKTFGEAFLVEPRGRWADSSLIARMRLQWLEGDQDGAQQSQQELINQRHFSTGSRALLFLSSSDLVQGRSDRAASWLTTAARLGKLPLQELNYWRGRLEESRGDQQKAVSLYLATLQENPQHPLGKAALQQLRSEQLAPVARRRGERFQTTRTLEDFLVAWFLLEESHPLRPTVKKGLLQAFSRDQNTSPYLQLTAQPPADWPMWKTRLQSPQEKLLALGIFEESNSVVLRHFPVRKPTLAFTGSQLLGQAGETRGSLYIAEILAKRIPDRIPDDLLPVGYRRLLFPFRYSYLILRETQPRSVDPFLLAGLIREESRFDPDAFSGASARGLTQFILPTARLIASEIPIDPIEPHDLERPEIAITLGAAYLQRLLQEFDGSLHQTIAAYNAGEPQSELWQRYCFSDERVEFLAKVAFRETRAYLARVLTSREHYRELYAPPD